MNRLYYYGNFTASNHEKHAKQERCLRHFMGISTEEMNYIGLDNLPHADAAEDLWRFVATTVIRGSCDTRMGATVCRMIHASKHAALILQFLLSLIHWCRAKRGHFMENDAANRFVKKCDAARIPRINV
jgi:hypothetical protein